MFSRQGGCRLCGNRSAQAAGRPPNALCRPWPSSTLTTPPLPQILASCPAALAVPPGAVSAVAAALLAAGVPRRAVGLVLSAAPASLLAGPAGVEAQVEFLAGLGVGSGAQLVSHPALLDPAARPRLRFLASHHGVPGARLGRALAAWPQLAGAGDGEAG